MDDRSAGPSANDTAEAPPALDLQTVTDGASPFGDWRDQLRERVREIRERKLATKRSGEPVDPSAAATAEKLRVAREHASETRAQPTPADARVEATAEPTVEATTEPTEAIAGPAVESAPAPTAEPAMAASRQAAATPPAPPATPTSALGSLLAPSTDPFEPAFPEGSLSNLLERLPQPAGSALETPSDTGAVALDATPVAPVPAPAPSDAASRAAASETPVATTAHPPTPAEAPLFQAEPTLFEDDPLLEFETEGAETGEPPPIADEHPEPDVDASSEPTDNVSPLPMLQPLPGAAEIPEGAPAWAIATAAMGGGGGVHPSSPPPADLSAVPADLEPAQIPAWALPRRHDGDSRPPDEVADGTEPRRIGTPLDSPSGLDAPTPETDAEDELDSDDFWAMPADSEIDPVPQEPAATPAEPERSAPLPPSHPPDVHIVGEYVGSSETRGTLERASTPFEPPRVPEPTPSAPPAPRPESPTLDTRFEPPASMSGVPPRSSWPSDDALPSGAPAGTTVDSSASEAPRAFPGLFDSAPADHAAPSTPDVPENRHDAMEWDLDAPTDPDTILDAQTDPLDPKAPWTDRVFSALADALVVGAIGLVLLIAGAAVAGTSILPFAQAAPLPMLLVWLLFGFGYAIFFNGTSGQTLGKMYMRIRVIGDDSFRIGYGQAAIRALGYTLATLPAGAGLIPAVRDPQGRALHDRISGTRVVKA